MCFHFNWNVISEGAPYVTISLLGIALNEASIKRLGIPENVMVGFDEDNLMLAIKPYHDEEGIKAYPLASRVRNGWVRIGCRDFIKYLESLTRTDYKSARKYVAVYDKGEGCLLVDLRQDNVKDENEEVETS